jgi:hypothetical protein
MKSRPCSGISHTWQTGADIRWGPMQGSDTNLCHVQYFVCNLSLLRVIHLSCATRGVQAMGGIDFRNPG